MGWEIKVAPVALFHTPPESAAFDLIYIIITREVRDLPDLSKLVRNYLYFPEPIPLDEPPPLWAGNGEEVWMECADGVAIHGLWWDDPAGAQALLFLHGNAQDVYSWSPVRQGLKHLACRILLIGLSGLCK